MNLSIEKFCNFPKNNKDDNLPPKTKSINNN